MKLKLLGLRTKKTSETNYLSQYMRIRAHFLAWKWGQLRYELLLVYRWSFFRLVATQRPDSKRVLVFFVRLVANGWNGRCIWDEWQGMLCFACIVFDELGNSNALGGSLDIESRCRWSNQRVNKSHERVIRDHVCVEETNVVIANFDCIFDNIFAWLIL